MANVPNDVLPYIFIHLLAKQLAQMRCVCKHWNTLLSEPSFIKSHLQRSIRKNEEILLFFENRPLIESSPAPLIARSSRSPHLELTKYMKLKLPLNPEHKIYWSIVIGSVNGLICFSYGSSHGGAIRIWNPSLSAVLTLPPSHFPSRICRYGFGFDPRSEDYKVIVLMPMLQKNNMETLPQGMVYSMRKGSWEIISQRFPSHIKQYFYQNESCLDGHLHWLCITVQKRRTIVTFDLGAETFREIALPDCITYDRRRHNNALGVLGGKLSVMSCVLLGECEVWVMNDDESWLKHHVFSLFDASIVPYRFTSRDEFLFQVRRYRGRFALYDPIEAKTKVFKIKMRHELERYKVIEYVDSLVWMAPVSKLQI